MGNHQKILPKLTLDTTGKPLRNCTTAMLQHDIPPDLPVHPHIDLLRPSRRSPVENPRACSGPTDTKGQLEKERWEHLQTRQHLFQEVNNVAWLHQERLSLITNQDTWIKAWTDSNGNLLRCDAERKALVHERTRMRQQLDSLRIQMQNLFRHNQALAKQIHVDPAVTDKDEESRHAVDQLARQGKELRAMRRKWIKHQAECTLSARSWDSLQISPDDVLESIERVHHA